MSSVLDSRVEESIENAAEALFALQRPDGSWPNRRPTAVLGTAGALAALHFADRERSHPLIATGGDWLLRNQNADGGWGGVPGAATQLVPTVIAAAALHMVAPAAARDEVRRAMGLLDSHGGLGAFTDPGMAHMAATFLGLAGLGDTRGARRIPLELLLLPRSLWRRKLSFRVGPFVAMALIQARGDLRYRLGRWAGLRTLAEMERRENRPGGYGGDNWLTALVCLGLVRAEAPRRSIAAAVDFLRSNVNTDGSWHIMQGLDLISGSYVARGLAECGYAPDPRVERTRRWLRGCQQTEAFATFGAPAGGWGWEGRRGWPNVLDSANVLSALVAGGDGPRSGLRWLAAKQDRRGSWSTFVSDTTLPNDGPCAYATAQCVDVLIESGVRARDTRVRRALDWLLANPRPDGTYEAVWYRGLVPGTATALVAFGRAGITDHPVARRARDALLAAQLDDGSWGPGQTGKLGQDPSTGTVEETAWALHGLLKAGVPAADARVRRAAGWITSAQRPDGLWDASSVCTYIRDFAYYVDGLTVNGLALKALGSYRAALRAGHAD
ncbi:prenyltransferase/squalene oxidase repeat-containing protein [Nocardiopsis rhodophaea]|uniref:prenyltransferase/squalene oxidase repeat-containing protein n=1 Tax=Nocardiopsis rhodophaea TaxID=280238 RepID=UPI0031D99B9D